MACTDPCSCCHGACCTDGSCSAGVNCYDCEAGGGTWQGKGTTCSPDPCVPECTADEDCDEYPSDTAACCDGACKYGAIDPGGCVDADTGICTDGVMLDECQLQNQSNTFFPCGCEAEPP